MPSTAPNPDPMQSLLKAARDAGDGLPPVDRWHPEYCGEMDMVIKRDGTWWHEGTRITRDRLVRLFSTILRKDRITGLRHDGLGVWSVEMGDDEALRIGRTYLPKVKAMAGR